MDFIEPEDVDLMQDLLDGKSITAEVRTSLCYGDLQNHDINDFWTLLLYTGYLTFDYNFPNCIAHPSSYSTLFFFGRPFFIFGAF